MNKWYITIFPWVMNNLLPCEKTWILIISALLMQWNGMRTCMGKWKQPWSPSIPWTLGNKPQPWNIFQVYNPLSSLVPACSKVDIVHFETLPTNSKPESFSSLLKFYRPEKHHPLGRASNQTCSKACVKPQGDLLWVTTSTRAEPQKRSPWKAYMLI